MFRDAFSVVCCWVHALLSHGRLNERAIFRTFFMACIFGGLASITIGRVCGEDEEVIVESGDSSLLSRAQELFENQQYDAALDLLIPLLQFEDRRPILTQRYESQDTGGEYRLYWPTGKYVQARFANWAERNPAILERYRKRSDSALTRFSPSWSELSLTDQSQIADRYRLNSAIDGQTLQLGIRLWELGRRQQARQRWLSLIPQAWAAVRTAKPVPSLTQALELQRLRIPTDSDVERNAEVAGKALAYLAMTSLVESDLGRAGRELELLRQQYPTTRLNVLGRDFNAVEWLMGAMRDAETEKGAGLESPEAAPNEATSLVLDWRVDLSVDWREDDDHWSKIYPSFREFLANRPRVDPSWRDGQVFWSEGDRVRMLWSDTGRPRFPAGPDWDDDPTRRGTIWEETRSVRSPSDGRSVVGIEDYSADLSKHFAMARVGDPRSIQRMEVPRNRSQLAAFDLQREGSLLAGFPLQNPLPGVEFEGNPVCDGERLFVLKRSSQPDSQQSRLTLVCYLLPAVQASNNLEPLWETVLCEASSLSGGQYHEISHPRLIPDGENLIVLTNLGAVVSVDTGRGAINWMIAYPRDLSLANRKTLPVHWLRSGKGAIRQGQSLWVLPADTSDLLCLDSISGELVWRCSLPDCLDLIDVGDRWIVLSGIGLTWVDHSMGSIDCRWPQQRWPLDPDLRGPTGAGGRATVEGDWLYWARGNDLWILERTLKETRVPGGNSWWQPHVARQFSLSDRGVFAGDLRMRYPRLWVVGIEGIAGLRFETSTGVSASE